MVIAEKWKTLWSRLTGDGKGSRTVHLSRLRCAKCGHAWVPRVNMVRRCPQCSSLRWDVV